MVKTEYEGRTVDLYGSQHHTFAYGYEQNNASLRKSTTQASSRGCVDTRTKVECQQEEQQVSESGIYSKHSTVARTSASSGSDPVEHF